MHNILVIGGAGFIGTHLCNLLVSKHHQVTCLDNYSSGSTSNHIPGVTYINGAAKDISALCHARFDTIFHFGEYSRVESSFDDIHQVFDNNLASIYAVLSFASRCNARLIYSASSSTLSEYASAADISPYTYVKGLNVNIIKQYAEWSGLNYAVCYFYNVYGHGEVDSGQFATVIGKFLGLRAAGYTQAPINAPGTQCRIFTHVLDTVSGVYQAAADKTAREFAINSCDLFSIVELAELIGLTPVIGPRVAGNRTDANLDPNAAAPSNWACQRSLRSYIQQRLASMPLDHKGNSQC